MATRRVTAFMRAISCRNPYGFTRQSFAPDRRLSTRSSSESRLVKVISGLLPQARISAHTWKG